IEKNQTGVGMAEDVGVTCGGVVRVKSDDNQARSMRGQVEAHPIDSVRQQNRRMIANRDVLLCECGTEPGNAFGNRAPSVIAPASLGAIVIAVGNGVGAAPDTLAEKPPQRARLTSSDCIAGDRGLLWSLVNRIVHRSHNSLARGSKAMMEQILTFDD